MKKEIIYLSIPYTFNPDKSFYIANKVASKLMQEGNVVFSPVSHSHCIADHMDEELRTSQEFWMSQDLPMVGVCDRMVVVSIGENGEKMIEESSGCQGEIKEAENLCMNIEIYNYAG